MARRNKDDRSRQGEGMNVDETREAGSRDRGMRQETGPERSQRQQTGPERSQRQQTGPERSQRQAGSRETGGREATPRREGNIDRSTRQESSRDRSPQRGSIERGSEGLRGRGSELEFEEQDVDLSERGGIERTGHRPSEQHDRTQDRNVDHNRM